MHSNWYAVSAALLAGLVASVPAAPARAAPITYILSGTGTGSIGATSFGGAFTFILNGDTAAVDTTGAPFYRLGGLGGTFTEGAVTASLTPAITLVATADPATPRINVFNATFDQGLGLNDPSLAGYTAQSAFGPVTVTAPGTANSFLTPTFNVGGNGFATSAGTLSFIGNSTLTFSAALVGPVPAPEPEAISMLGLGVLGLGLMRRRA